MSRRRAIQTRLRTLGEMGHIMDGMKTLALLETRKLAHYLDTQQRVVSGLEETAAAFLGGYPDSYRPATPERQVWLVLGSERGFCGDFNERLRRILYSTASGVDQVITVGQKLGAQMEHDTRVVLSMGGPTVAEEVDEVLSRIVLQLQQLESRQGACALTVLSHDETTARVEKHLVLPPFQQLRKPPAGRGYPPRLYLPPEQFLQQLLEHYLFAVLHERFYASLMMENRQRMEHLDGAIQHLAKTTTRLQLKNNYLRQEEITEELEEVLLGAEVLGPAC